MKKNTKKKGFTLVELIVVIAILGILAAVMIPRFTGFQSKARGTQALVYAKQVATAIDAWETEKGTWPTAGNNASADAQAIKATAGLDTTANLTLLANGGFEVGITGADTKRYWAGRTGSGSVAMRTTP